MRAITTIRDRYEVGTVFELHKADGRVMERTIVGVDDRCPMTPIFIVVGVGRDGKERERKLPMPTVRDLIMPGQGEYLIINEPGQEPARFIDLGKIGNAWTPSNGGQTRYYVNDWKELIGMEPVRNKAGIRAWLFDGAEVRGGEIAKTKVWIGEDLSIHVEWMEYEDIKARIIDTLTAKIDALGQEEN